MKRLIKTMIVLIALGAVCALSILLVLPYIEPMLGLDAGGAFETISEIIPNLNKDENPKREVNVSPETIKKYESSKQVLKSGYEVLQQENLTKEEFDKAIAELEKQYQNIEDVVTSSADERIIRQICFIKGLGGNAGTKYVDSTPYMDFGEDEELYKEYIRMLGSYLKEYNNEDIQDKNLEGEMTDEVVQEN